MRDLSEYQLELLDSYIVEVDLYKEHLKASSSFLNAFKKTLPGKHSVSDLVSIAFERRTWLNNNPFARVVADKNVDEQAWLDARRKGVTATEVAKLAKGQPAERAKMILEKLTGERSFFGNKYTAWGLEREEPLGRVLLSKWGLNSSDTLFHAPGNDRHLATPDALRVADGSVLIGEIKTSKNDLDPSGAFFKRSGYMDQMQWQMYVMGPDCKSCVFLWEIHDDNWVIGVDGVERPEACELGTHIVERDEARIEHLVGLADEFLAELEWAA